MAGFDGERRLSFSSPRACPGVSLLLVLRGGQKERGGWVYIMADRYRGTMYMGATANLAARVRRHRNGIGSNFCGRYGLTRLVWAERTDDIGAAIEYEKRVKRWRRAWKFDLIERTNAD